MTFIPLYTRPDPLYRRSIPLEVRADSLQMHPETMDAIAYGIAKLMHTPLADLEAEAAAHRGVLAAHVGAAPSVTDQLAHLDHLVALHETFWAEVAQRHPTPEMREFLRRHWDPWYAQWIEKSPLLFSEQGRALLRSQLERRQAHDLEQFGTPQRRQRTIEDAPGTAHFESMPVPTDLLAAVVHEAAQGLSGLREYAAYNGVPTPDLGTSQHGFVHPGEQQMVSGDSYPHGSDFIGADAIERYRDVARRAVSSAHHQSPSPVYGYLRTGSHQKVYLFNVLDDAHAWYVQLEPGYDYAAVFTAADLHTPISEDLGGTIVSGDGAEVGHWLLPLALGVPAGAYGGYKYREWQEAHPGKILPWVSGETPWELVGAQADGETPWELVGAQADDDVARRRAWPRTKALIHSAIREVLDSSSTYPAEAYVWSLEAPGTLSRPGVELYGTTTITPFASHEEALAHMRDRIQTEHVALALFDRSSPHWPNPVNWNKSNDPSHEHVIAQQIAKYAPTVAAGEVGEFVGGPWVDLIGAAIDVFRKQAQAAAEIAPGPVVGLRRDARNQWQIEQFRSADDADDWFGHATAEPAHFTYAAYFDKRDPMFPQPLNEAIGGARAASPRGLTIHRGIGEAAA